MTKQLTIIVAAFSIVCGSIACSSTITAEPWRLKKSRADAVEREEKDAGAAVSDADSDDDDSNDNDHEDAGE